VQTIHHNQQLLTAKKMVADVTFYINEWMHAALQ